jgi:hypothetical protein
LNTADQIQENEIFEGATNPFVYQRYFDLEVRCNYKFYNFPFDQQECQVIVSTSTVEIFFTKKYILSFHLREV